MKKLFLIIALLSILMVVVTSIFNYWISTSANTESQRQSLETVTKGAAIVIAKQTQYLTQLVQHVAEQEEIQGLVRQKDLVGLKSRLTQLQSVLPGVMAIRIILPDNVQLDTSQVPHLGYADLEMVRETFKANQQAVVQGDKGPNRHLAIARGVVINEQVAAVLLVSLKYHYLLEGLKEFLSADGRIELKQGNVVLASAGRGGEAMLKAKAIKVAGTPWKIYMQAPVFNGWADLGLYAAVLIGVVIGIVLLSIFGFFRMKEVLRSDLHVLVMVAKDLVKGKKPGNYSVFLDEVKLAIRAISRTTKKQGITKKVKVNEDDSDSGVTLDEFFDEVSGHDDLDLTASSLVGEYDDQDKEEISKETQIAKNKNNSKTAVVIKSNQIEKIKNISGVVGQNLDADAVNELGRAIGTELKEKGVNALIIARDGHTSNSMFFEPLQKALTSTGINILDMGVVPLPALYFAIHHHSSKTGLMLCGFDDSPQLADIKAFVNGDLISTQDIASIQQRLELGDFINDESGGTVDIDNTLVDKYINEINKEINIARPMKIVLDCGNSVASSLAPKVFKKLGCDVITIQCDTAKKRITQNINLAEQKYLNPLIKAVAENQADIGFTFYGEARRLDVVDAHGNVIMPDQQMILYAKDVLKLIPGASIVYDSMCSNTLVAEISKNEGAAEMIKVGHEHIRRKLKHNGVHFAGGMNGHFYFNDRWYGFDDGIYSAARMLELLSLKNISTTAVFASFPTRKCSSYHMIAMSQVESIKFVTKLAEAAIFPEGKITCFDCLRVDFVDGWGIARPSPSTVSVEFRFEADNEQALQRIRDDFKKFMTDVKPGMKIPF